MDSGLGMRVFGVFCRGVGLEGEKEGEGEEDGGGEEVEVEVEVEVEDRRVLGAALAAICNIVNEFSPLRPVGPSSTPYVFCLELIPISISVGVP